MNDNRKEKLINLGAEALSQALLELAPYSKEANDLIKRLLATPKENERRFKENLLKLQQSDRYIDWRGSADFGQELSHLLMDLEASVKDPLSGIKHVISFFESDEVFFEICDDSHADVSNVFLYDAKELFAHYASCYQDKNKLIDMVLTLCQKDDYCVRHVLVDCAEDYLPETSMRAMIERLRKLNTKKSRSYHAFDCIALMKSLARQLKDAELLEKICLDFDKSVSTKSTLDIAKIHFESGDVNKAHDWLNKIPENDSSHGYERDELSLKILKKQGNSKKIEEALYENFRLDYSSEDLEELLDVIGHDKREKVIEQEVALIMKDSHFEYFKATFLISVSKIDEAEAYLLTHADQLDGNFYYRLRTIAEEMASAQRYLIATICYRAMLTSVLERGYSKAYHHGIHYLEQLDKMAESFEDWKQIVDHQTFKEQLRKKHGRKKSFWSEYHE